MFLLVIGALPWLQPIIKTVELFGVKLELQELKNQVAEARGAAESANRQAALAVSASTSSSSASSRTDQRVAISDTEALMSEYERVRDDMRPGDARTNVMTDVVRRMIDLAQRTNAFDVDEALRSQSSGRRLFAYAYLYAHPNPQCLPQLVDSVTAQENTPFGQYWGLQSIGQVMSNLEHVGPEIKKKLAVLEAKLPSGTDREYEVRRLLRQAG
jgi:hypothetical protein